jgi:hypothetical protein
LYLKDKVTGQVNNNNDLNVLYYLPNTTKMIKLRRIVLAGHVGTYEREESA